METNNNIFSKQDQQQIYRKKHNYNYLIFIKYFKRSKFYQFNLFYAFVIYTTIVILSVHTLSDDIKSLDNIIKIEEQLVQILSYRLIFIYIFTIIIAIIILQSFIRFIINTKQRGFQMGIYLLLIGWLISSLSKQIINIIAYHRFMKQKQNQSDILPNFSAIFYTADICSVFFILWLIIIIPYHWIGQSFSVIEDQQIDIGHRKIIHKIFKILKGVRLYIYLRIIVVLALIAVSFYAILNKKFLQFLSNNILITFFIVQSLLCIVFYIFGQLQTTKIKKYLPLQPNHYIQIKIQYMLLMLISSFRAVFNAAFYFIPFGIEYTIKLQNCAILSDQADNNSYKIFNTVFLSIGQILMHFLPILIVIYIYKPQNAKINSSIKKDTLHHLQKTLTEQ